MQLIRANVSRCAAVASRLIGVPRAANNAASAANPVAVIPIAAAATSISARSCLVNRALSRIMRPDG